MITFSSLCWWTGAILSIRNFVGKRTQFKCSIFLAVFIQLLMRRAISFSDKLGAIAAFFISTKAITWSSISYNDLGQWMIFMAGHQATQFSGEKEKEIKSHFIDAIYHYWWFGLSTNGRKNDGECRPPSEMTSSSEALEWNYLSLRASQFECLRWRFCRKEKCLPLVRIYK